MCSFFVSRAALSGILRNRCAVFFFGSGRLQRRRGGGRPPRPWGLVGQVLSFDVARRL